MWCCDALRACRSSILGGVTLHSLAPKRHGFLNRGRIISMQRAEAQDPYDPYDVCNVPDWQCGGVQVDLATSALSIK